MKKARNSSWKQLINLSKKVVISIIAFEVLLSQIVLAQVPNFSYSQSANTLVQGIAFSITPVNTGGAVNSGTAYGTVTTFAGSGAAGLANGTGTAAEFNLPWGICVDASGTLYVTDRNNHEIRQITSSGVVTLLAGSPTGNSGNNNNTTTSAALFNWPAGITFDGNNTLYISETYNQDIKQIDLFSSYVYLYAGSPSGIPGISNGNGAGALFDTPSFITYDQTSGNLYTADSDGNDVRLINTSTKDVTLFAGSPTGYPGNVNATGSAALFSVPEGVATDLSGNLYVADGGNNQVRKITSAGAVSTLAGGISSPSGIATDAGGNVYVVANGAVHYITAAGVVTTVCGSSSFGYVDGVGTAAMFNEPLGIALDPTGQYLYVADGGNNMIRKVSIWGYTISPSLPAGLTFDGTTGKISGTPTSAFTASTYTVTAFNQFGSASTTITLSCTSQAPNISYQPSTNVLSQNIRFSITPNNTGGSVPGNVYTVTTFGGSTSGTLGLTNGTGTAARFWMPSGITTDGSGTLYVADQHNNEIRAITSAGVVTLFAGSAAGAGGMVNASGTAASFNGPTGITTDGAGNLYVTDRINNQVRKIVISTGAVTLLAGSATGALGRTNGTGTGASFNNPRGIVYNSFDGMLYVCDQNNNEIRKVNPSTGAVTLFAGSTTGGSGRANGTGTTATFSLPCDITIDASGFLYVADYNNNEIRKITSAGAVALYAGSASGATGSADGTSTTASFHGPSGIASDGIGNLYICDQLNNTIRFITPSQVVTTIAGSTTSGFVDANGTSARFNGPYSLTYDHTTNSLFVTENTNNAIRKITAYGYFIGSSLPTGLSFDNSTGNITGISTAPFSGTLYVVYAVNAYGTSFVIITLSCTNPTNADWKGNTSSNWNTASNWAPAAVPTSTTTVRIGVTAITGNQPTINSNATVSALEFGSSSNTLTIASGVTLTASAGVSVDLDGRGVIQGPGTIAIGSGRAASINSSGALSLLSNAVLSIGSGTSLTNSGTFTLGSDASGSSSIAAIPSGASVVGTVTVQRYLAGGAGHRGYRLLTSPVYASTDNYLNKIYSVNYLTSGTYVTGYGGTSGGFNQYGNPSLYLYRENLTTPYYGNFTGSNYRSINNMSASPAYTFDSDGGPYNIPVGNGYLVFFRGGTSTVNPYSTTSTPAAATMSTSGTLVQGTINVSLWFQPSSATLSYTSASLSTVRGFNLVGNPYPCTINFEKFNRNGANSSIYGSGFTTPATIYFFNPVTKQYCGYQQKSTISSAADTTTSINPGTSSDGYATNMIASGEAFFIKTTSASQALRFTESAKVTTQPSTATLGEILAVLPKNKSNNAANQPEPLFRLRMIADSVNSDEVVLLFNNQDSATYSEQKDALDLGGNGAKESLSLLSSDSIQLCIHRRALPGKTEEIIPLLVDATASGIYQLKKIQLDNLPKLYDVWLLDAFMKDSLDVTANDTYSFNIDKTNPATFGTKRFSLVIRQNPGYAYRLRSFTALKVPNTPARQVQLSWLTENESTYTSFTVERSTDGGKSFDVIGSVQGNGLGQYGLVDNNAAAGQNLYRLKQTDVNNTISYSDTLGLEFSGIGNNIANNVNIYPNPASNTLNLVISEPVVKTTTYGIEVINSSGMTVRNATSASTTWQSDISSLIPGTYTVRVIDNKDKSFIGEAKLIKQ